MASRGRTRLLARAATAKAKAHYEGAFGPTTLFHCPAVSGPTTAISPIARVLTLISGQVVLGAVRTAHLAAFGRGPTHFLPTGSKTSADVPVGVGLHAQKRKSSRTSMFSLSKRIKLCLCSLGRAPFVTNKC